MKKILGLDLGTASIGWAMVNQSETKEEKSSILGCGSRVVPLSSDEKDCFEKGKAITTNADRRLKRGMRRNLQRRKQRRDNLRSVFVREGWIDKDASLSEEGKGSTYDTLRLRAEAASNPISLYDLSRVLLSINNKRGYKSSRKTDASETGQLINGMEIAKLLQTRGLTPGQYALEEALAGRKGKIEFYRSDLEAEYDLIWDKQSQHYPELLTDEFKKQLFWQGKNGTSKIFYAKYNIVTADIKGKDKRIQGLEYRVKALSERLDVEALAYVIADLRGEISNTSGYLGAISDRSKELYFNNETVGQSLYRNVLQVPGFSTKNKVFYRQDYIYEFERIWEVQAKGHPELTDELKKEIANHILFYQRPLKSQKGHIAFCEFESSPIKVNVDGVLKAKMTGSRVAPKSSPLFQEFKIWQILNNVSIIDRKTEETRSLHQGEKELLSKELSIKETLKQTKALKMLSLNPRQYELNYKELQGNNTIAALYGSFIEIVNASGHGEYDLSKLRHDEAMPLVSDVLTALGCTPALFSLSTDLPKEEYEKQPLFRLWHLLYSYEGDKSNTGVESLHKRIAELTGLSVEYARIIAGVTFKDDYASVSHKAMKKILPFLKQGYQYDSACALAGYNHSGYETAEERDSKTLKDHLDLLPAGALRNPVVEKIINQMINVVNAAAEAYGKPDEIHIELARELKKSAKEREQATSDIQSSKKRNDEIEQILKESFHIQNVKKADIIRYRLYEELKENGYKTLYSNKYIPVSALFSKEIDIEHIIPQALMFDDSFANKTLEFKDINIEKGRRTANDYVKEKWGDEYYEQYRLRIDDLFNRGVISKRKRQYLIMPETEIPSGFVDRDLRNSQYIAKKSREILEDYVRTVMPTSGSVTDCLREQWQLVDVMKELNFDKYDKASRTYTEADSDGRQVKRIQDWTKRNDHRHHAMDAITIAFTRPSHIQILNNLRARSDKDEAFEALFSKETAVIGKKRIFVPPMPLDELRRGVRESLSNVLVSIKAKNKVVTKNINRIQSADGLIKKTELTPRGALHKEQVYGLRLQYETYYVPVGSKMTAEEIANVASKKEREALLARLMQFEGDAKKAFTGKNAIDKNPLFVDDAHSRTVPAKVKCVRMKNVFSIRKDLTPDLQIDKIIDGQVKKRIRERIESYGGNAKAALSNLETNPIWLDDAQTIRIKRVTIKENFDLYAIRSKRDKNGIVILDGKGQPVPNDYVNLNSNHHVALYKDADGRVQESVVPMLEALNRINRGEPVIDKNYHSDLGWTFLFSLKINEMFVFPDPATGFNPKDIDLMDPANASLISPYLYRVQKLSDGDYSFRHHQETTIENDKALRDITWKRISNIQTMIGAVKVRVDHLGRIVSVGEYD